MAFKIILFSTLLIASACGTANNTGMNESGEKTFVVTGTIQTHNPYCGGARPTPEIENGFSEPIPNAVYYIYSGDRPKTAKDMTKITTNADGKFTVSLPNGLYSVIQESKLLPLEQFIELKSIKGDFYTNGDSECFSNWKKGVDFSFNVESSDCSPLFTEIKRCFTGANPCLEYEGPYPP